MKKRYLYPSAVLLLFHTAFPQSVLREVKRSDEKEVRVRIESSFGSVNIAKGSPDRIVRVQYRKTDKEHRPKLDLDYSVRKGIGDLRLDMQPEDADVREDEDGSGVHINANVNFKNDEWYVDLAEGIPMSMKVELGAGKSNFDLSGLTVTDLSISTGASSSQLNFGEPNKAEIRDLSIESGVSKFVANNLNNANFRRMSFEGGVGTYVLDFGGELKHEAKVDISVGLGSMTIIVPKNIGVRVKYEDSWLSNLSLDDDDFIRRKKGIYESQNYAAAEGRMEFSVESGLGSVRIKRSK